jgi:hypothetical protein
MNERNKFAIVSGAKKNLRSNEKEKPTYQNNNMLPHHDKTLPHLRIR